MSVVNCGICHAVKLNAIPPAERMQLAFINAPALQYHVNAKRCYIMAHLALNVLDSLIVKVVVVIVGYKQHINIGNIFGI